MHPSTSGLPSARRVTKRSLERLCRVLPYSAPQHFAGAGRVRKRYVQIKQIDKLWVQWIISTQNELVAVGKCRMRT
jgi:hypothetical protein